MVLRAGGRQRVGGDKVYIEYLHVTKLEITLSFLPAPGMLFSLDALPRAAFTLTAFPLCTLTIRGSRWPLIASSVDC